MLRSALLRLAVVAAIAVPYGTTARAVDLHPLAPGAVRLRLVTAEGLVAGGVDARLMIIDGLAKVDGPRSAVVHTLKTDASGVVDIDFPDDDPYVVANPGQARFNVEVHFVAHPAPGLTAELMASFVYDRNIQREVTVVPVSGRTLALPVAKIDTPPPYPPEMKCSSPPPDAAAYECVATTYPEKMNANETVFATNAGAGFDTTLEITYEEAGRVETSWVHETSVGVVQTVDTTVAIDNADVSRLVFSGGNVRYGNRNELAVIMTSWAMVERQYCERPAFPFSGPPTCSHDGASWWPNKVQGAAQRDRSAEHKIWHDKYCNPYSPSDCPDGAYMQCLTPFPSEYTFGTGSEELREYQGQVALDGHDWVINVPLKASAKYTRSEKNSKLSAYHYKATSPSQYDHYLWTYTNLPYDETAPGGGVCPETNIGDTWTTTEALTVAPDPMTTGEQAADAADDAVETPTDRNPGAGNTTRSAGRCRYVPEDCRPGVVFRARA
jgi:hypothetical protein